jgi:hypothetical protein
MDAMARSLPDWLWVVEQAEIVVERSTTIMKRKSKLRVLENMMCLQKGWLNGSPAACLLPAHYGGKTYAPNGL